MEKGSAEREEMTKRSMGPMNRGLVQEGEGTIVSGVYGGTGASRKSLEREIGMIWNDGGPALVVQVNRSYRHRREINIARTMLGSDVAQWVRIGGAKYKRNGS